MNMLSIFCIYAIGFLLTYKYVISYFMEDFERYTNFYHRQTVAILVSTFWWAFWPATFFVFVEDIEND